jgi:hypothetical protein
MSTIYSYKLPKKGPGKDANMHNPVQIERKHKGEALASIVSGIVRQLGVLIINGL